MVFCALFFPLRVSPAIVAEDIDSQGYRLEEQARIEMLVPEHQEEEECIYITNVEVIFAVASCKEDTGEAKD